MGTIVAAAAAILGATPVPRKSRVIRVAALAGVAAALAVVVWAGHDLVHSIRYSDYGE